MVLLASIPGSVSDGLPISSLDLPPRASLPWQIEQPLSSNSLAPCAAVPLPAGRPVPSGRMVMSQALMSASVTGLPRFGVLAANAAEEARVKVTTASTRGKFPLIPAKAGIQRASVDRWWKRLGPRFRGDERFCFPRAIKTDARILSIDMFDLPVGADGP